MTLYDAIFERHSVRDYLEQPFPREIRYDLGEKADDICEEGDLNVQLVIGEKEAFSGINSYGRFHGAQNYFIMTCGLVIMVRSSSCFCRPLGLILVG